MKYKVSCYNGSRIFKVEANNEAEALTEARKRVARDFYKVIRAEG